MNKVYLHTNDTTPLTPEQIAEEANIGYSNSAPFTADMFRGPGCRIDGAGHGYCDNNCEFVLDELTPETLSDLYLTGKRYMVCRKCGAVSHL